MKTSAILLTGLVLSMSVSRTPLAQQQPVGAVDVKKVNRFCDIGFRFTANGIQFDLDKLLVLGLKVEPKVLQALSSQGALVLAELTWACRMMAAGFITPELFLAEARTKLQYAKDLEAIRAQAERLAGVPASEKPDPRLDAGVVAEEELGIRVEAAIDTDGELTVILQRLAQRYLCTCRQGRDTRR